MESAFVRYDQEKMLEVMSCRYMTRDRQLSYKNGGNNVRGVSQSRSQSYKSFVPTMGSEEEEETTAKEQRAWWQIEVCKKHQVHTQRARARGILTNHDAYSCTTKARVSPPTRQARLAVNSGHRAYWTRMAQKVETAAGDLIRG